MEPHLKTDDTQQSRSVLEAQIRECFGRVVYTHKTHEKTADIYIVRQNRVRLSQIILSSLTTAGFVVVFFGKGQSAAAIGVLVSVVLLVLNAYAKQSSLGELIQKHKQAATELWLIREQYLSLLTDLVMGERPIESLQTSRDELMNSLYKVYKVAPPTLNSGYSRAQQALKYDEDLTFSDAEIDAFLPQALKKGHRPDAKDITKPKNQSDPNPPMAGS